MLLFKVCPLFQSTRFDKVTQLLFFPLPLPSNMGDSCVNNWSVLCGCHFFLVVDLLFSPRLTLFLSNEIEVLYQLSQVPALELSGTSWFLTIVFSPWLVFLLSPPKCWISRHMQLPLPWC